jgi:hypothetical protein
MMVFPFSQNANFPFKHVKDTCTELTLIDISAWDRRSHDRMAVGFTTTCAISTYHH